MNNADLVAEGPNNNNQNGKEPKKRGLFGTYLKYGFMPGFGERFKRFSLQLGHFAYLLAMVYGAVRLIKPGHPVLNPANIGKFGFRDVVSAAAENVIISKQTIDQVLIFGAVLLGIALVAFQAVAILIIAGTDFYTSIAHAQDFGSLFTVEDPTKDLGLIGLEMVFGTELFEARATILPIVGAMHAMLAFFSYAMLLIAIFLLIYYVFVVVGEAAISGTPFGRRFNGFYAPIRLCLAFGLLIPVAGGLNVAQYSTLWVAKMGSNMASNAWAVFSTEFFNPKNFAVLPAAPSLREFVGTVFINELCMYAHNELNSSGGNNSHKSIERRVRIPKDSGGFGSMDYMAYSPASATLNGNRDSVKIYWSSRMDDNSSPNARCGSIEMYLANSDDLDGMIDGRILDQIRLSYFDVLKDTIGRINTAPPLTGPSGTTVGANLLDSLIKIQMASEGDEEFGAGSFGDAAIAADMVAQVHDTLESATQEALDQIKGDESSEIAERMAARGWVGAASNFNIVARINGLIYDAVHEPIPQQDEYPTIINAVNASPNPLKPRGFISWVYQRVTGDEPSEVAKATVQVMDVAGTWFAEGLETSEQGALSATGSAVGGVMKHVGNFIRDVFGFGILGMRDEYSANPLGQLAMGGKALIDKALLAFGAYAATVIAIGLSPIGTVGPTTAAVLGGIVNFLVSMGLSAGFVLYFMVPLLPFMYFLFAVVGWLSEIFEAIVAMPLWALAHIRIDGDGLPGQAASGGYYLLFMIFIRPIMIVFGLIGAYLTFSVGVFLLNVLFNDTVLNLRADEEGISRATGAIYDAVGFTIIYVIIVYNMANSSFKLIDAVPNQILRWMGNSTPSFSDGRNVDLGTMQGVAAYATNQVASQGVGGITNRVTSGANQKASDNAAAEQRTKDNQRSGKQTAAIISAIKNNGR